MNDSGLRVILAGGGTGGHVIPALAIAGEIVHRGGHARFVGTRDRIEARLVPEAGFAIDFINARPLAGGGARGVLIGAASAPLTIARSVGILRAFRPQVVVGVGGYVAGPVVLAAWLSRIPTVVLEQNATVGLTNRILSRLVNRAFVTYEETLAAFPAARVELTGNPVKQSIIEAGRRISSRQSQGLFRVLVMGGSQGSWAIDQRIPAAMAAAGLRDEVTVLHQCGNGRKKAVIDAYRAAGIEALVVDFIVDTARAYSEADLVVARAGATTVSELNVMGLPAVFLPYPYHTDRQQERNAAPMAAAGAAVILDERMTGVVEMAEAISRFVRDARYRKRAATASASLARPDAAARIVDELVDLVGGVQ